MPQPPRRCARVPLVRGLIRLFSALAPLFRGAGVAGRGERLLLVAALLAPLSLIVLPQSASLPVGIGTAVVLLAWMLRGRTLFLHGAEHRAIAAAEERRLVATWHAEAKPSRFAPRCGTNFAALVVPVSIAVRPRLAGGAGALHALRRLAALAGADDGALADRAGLALRVARVFLLPGLALQRVTTREPSDEETRLALTAVASCCGANSPRDKGFGASTPIEKVRCRPSTVATSASRRPSACSGAPASARARARPSGSRKLGLDGAVHSLTHPRPRAAERARARTTTTATRSRPSTPGATTTSGGSTGWCARRSRSSSG